MHAYRAFWSPFFATFWCTRLSLSLAPSILLNIPHQNQPLRLGPGKTSHKLWLRDFCHFARHRVCSHLPGQSPVGERAGARRFH